MDDWFYGDGNMDDWFYEDEDFADSDSSDPLTITLQPQSVTGPLWDFVELQVEVSGGVAPLHYQWQYAVYGTTTFYNSTSEGNTSNVLIPQIEENIYDYRCVITDAEDNMVISDTASVGKEYKAIVMTPTSESQFLQFLYELFRLLFEFLEYTQDEMDAAFARLEEWLKSGAKADPYPTITRQPRGVMGEVGEWVELRIEVAGEFRPFKYQWEYREYGTTTFYRSTSEGSKTSALRVPVNEKIYDYRCVVTSLIGFSVTSDIARVEKTITMFTFPLSISQQPPAAVVSTGYGFCGIFTKATGGFTPYKYQWERWFENYPSKGKGSWVPLEDGIYYKGTQTQYLQAATDKGISAYRCKVTDRNGHGQTVTTSEVRLFRRPESYAYGMMPPVIMNSGRDRIDSESNKRVSEYWVEAAAPWRHALTYQWQYQKYVGGDEEWQWINLKNGPMPGYDSTTVTGVNSPRMRVVVEFPKGVELIITPGPYRCVVTCSRDGRQAISKEIW